MYWNKRFLIIIALLFVVFGNVLAQSPYRIRLADSTYAAQLRGVTGTRTAGITITGTYKSNFRAHQFNVTTTGRYDLYIDATGTGSSYSKDAVWSGTVGKTVTGKTDLERTVSLGVYADPDSNAQIDTQGYEDGSITIIKLADETKAYVATGGSFTSDSLRDMIGDSVAALSADGVTITNSGGTFKQVVFADTTALKAVAGLEGNTVVLKQLSSGNANGGGLFIWKTIGTPDNVTTFAASGGYWVRKEWIDNKVVNVKWAGAKGDDSTDDSLAISKANAVAVETGGSVYFPQGTYVYTGSIIDSSSEERTRKVLFGDGQDRTILKPIDDVDAIKVYRGGNGYSTNLTIRGFTIEGKGKSISTSAAVNLDSTGWVDISECKILGWKYAIYATQPNNNKIVGNFITSNKWGAYLLRNPNACIVMGNTFSQTDSACFYQRAGQGTVILANEWANSKNFIFADSLARITVIGGNFEQGINGGEDIRLFYQSYVALYGSRFLAFAGRTNIFAALRQSSQLSLNDVFVDGYDMTITNQHIYVDGHTSIVTQRNTNRDGYLRAYLASKSFHYFPQENVSYPFDVVYSADSTRRGEIHRILARNTNEIDWMRFTAKTAGIYRNLDLSSYTDWRFNVRNPDSTNFAKVYGMVFLAGRDTVTINAGDSTDIAIDIGQYATLYSATGTVQAATETGTQPDVFATLLSANSSTGILTYRLWHRDFVSGGRKVELHYLIMVDRY